MNKYYEWILDTKLKVYISPDVLAYYALVIEAIELQMFPMLVLITMNLQTSLYITTCVCKGFDIEYYRCSIVKCGVDALCK